MTVATMGRSSGVDLSIRRLSERALACFVISIVLELDSAIPYPFLFIEMYVQGNGSWRRSFYSSCSIIFRLPSHPFASTIQCIQTVDPEHFKLAIRCLLQ